MYIMMAFRERNRAEHRIFGWNEESLDPLAQEFTPQPCCICGLEVSKRVTFFVKGIYIYKYPDHIFVCKRGQGVNVPKAPKRAA